MVGGSGRLTFPVGGGGGGGVGDGGGGWVGMAAGAGGLLKYSLRLSLRSWRTTMNLKTPKKKGL